MVSKWYELIVVTITLRILVALFTVNTLIESS